MVEIQSTPPQSHSAQQTKNVFKMKSSDRMGGSMPVWGKVETAKEDVMHRLVTSGNPTSNFDHALSLQSNADDAYVNTNAEAFGMGDIVDMVNPLQHIPVVSHLYREVTGDDIKPIGKIIGGGLFGGAAGIASGLVNTVIEEETGDDIAGNAMNLVMKSKRSPVIDPDAPPTQRLNNALDEIKNPQQDLPAALLAFTSTGEGPAAHSHARKAPRTYYQDPTSGNASAEKNWRSNTINNVADANLAAREAITVITLSDLPRHKDL